MDLVAEQKNADASAADMKKADAAEGVEAAAEAKKAASEQKQLCQGQKSCSIGS